ncbi:hypothetical protein Ancab_012270 [Ancistrocladus abbreviatus]
MGRNDCKGKSSRKPLREVTNHCRTNPSQSPKNEKPSKTETESIDGVDGDVIHHLLSVHSHISAALHQIDDLVTQAVEVRATNKNGMKEIESFAYVLSEILSSLKPWVPRFQKVLPVSSIECEDQLIQSFASGIDDFINEDAKHGDESPEPSKLESLVSPSPLVSWRAADFSVEQNKQLFLLTPLPRCGKSMAKGQTLSKSVTFEKAGVYTLFVDNGIDTFGILAKSTSENLPDSIAKDKENGEGFLSPPNFPKKDHSMIMTTPCLKVSPPRSCALLEPNCEFSQGNFDKFHKSTPFPIGKQIMRESPDSETSSSEHSNTLGLKYTTLLRIKPASMSRNGRKQLEASPAWFMSPPKTCTLMQPFNNKCLNDATLISSDQMYLVPRKVNDVEGNCQQTEKLASPAGHGGSFPLEESTPMCRASESAIQTGKHLGENTLKKELWTKFEAASTEGLHLNYCLFQRTVQKGFLDRLEEASCDER